MDRILYKSDILDPTSGFPVYIFDTSFLPSTESINYEEFIPTLMTGLPTSPYVLIMFSCGLNKISWIWGIKFLKKFLADSSNLDNLLKIITVHDSWFVKSITQIFANYNMTKKNFAQLNKLIDTFTITTLGDLLTSGVETGPSSSVTKNVIIHCSSISQLSNYVDITKLKISLNVYKHNLLIENEIKLAMRYTPLLNPYTKLHPQTNPVFYHHFYQIFNIINNYGDKVELLFHKPGNKINTDVFYQCIDRNQLIWINDWDLYCISTGFKRILMELSSPLISSSIIPLPIKDDFTYTFNTFQKIFSVHSQDASNEFGQLLVQICDLCHKILKNNDITKHTPLTLSKSLCYSLSHELISSHNKDSISIVIRFFKNTLEYWDDLSKKFSYTTVKQIVNGDNNQKLDDSYDLSYDLTVDEAQAIEADEEEENYRVSFITTNILNSSERPLPYHAKTQSFSTDNAYPHTPKSVTSHRSASPTRGHEGSDSMFSGYSSNSSASSAFTLTSSTNSSANVPNPSPYPKKKLSDVSNLFLQHPPQKYKFESTLKTGTINSQHSRSKSLPPQLNMESTVPVKKPVIRGRKVGELAKLFEERTQGLELLSSM
ncbi:uncharacterized protein CANTADRAFT_26959 [Suhomyces tanzawaensis NRRL Y-17324]|uniref:Uncharacterized protein n=1 Tax=Suhomyces tanzawaensis NRRL Y-17324 TaxID=984487 RepID=A0A1E4SET6_9ASCO|nr:uncharacterized protein CANTADRAFT_26959 [Suhomyces tanzawaensis NRRL Y-17324]ODV77993.1 hypothetical protein CANTADRAFT_26959 [Suhomyces tanzawaensis NRRL Y-17324]